MITTAHFPWINIKLNVRLYASQTHSTHRTMLWTHKTTLKHPSSLMFSVASHPCLLSCQYFSAQSHDPLLQLDRRRHSGFHIEDVASCRLTVHILSDTRTFTGTLITNAPSSSLIMQRLGGHTPDWDAPRNVTNASAGLLRSWVWGEGLTKTVIWAWCIYLPLDIYVTHGCSD